MSPLVLKGLNIVSYTVFVNMFDRKVSNFQKNPENDELYYGRTYLRSNISTVEHIYEYGTFFF